MEHWPISYSQTLSRVFTSIELELFPDMRMHCGIKPEHSKSLPEVQYAKEPAIFKCGCAGSRWSLGGAHLCQGAPDRCEPVMCQPRQTVGRSLFGIYPGL